MKLLYRTTRDFLLSTIIILALTGTGLYLVLQREISNEMDEQLLFQAAVVSEQLGSDSLANYPFVHVTKITAPADENPHFGDTLIYDRLQHVTENYYYLDIVKKIKNDHYRIKVMTSYIGWGDFYKTISISLIAAIFLLVFTGVMINYYSNKRIWKPFFANLEAIRRYSVRSNSALILNNSAISEFKELEITLKDLADRSRKDYLALREFTENASHELQTPLSIVQSKLDRISQLNIDEEVSIYIVQAKSGIERLNKMNKNLLLLAKLDNDSFDDKQVVRLDELILEQIRMMEDLFAARNIVIKTNITETSIFANQYLCEVLISNLFSNAVRYTSPGGTFSVNLEAMKCSISNTGLPLDFPSEFLFDRFRKGSQHIQSNGLGLAIVRQICLMNKWKIMYDYEHGNHTFHVSLV